MGKTRMRNPCRKSRALVRVLTSPPRAPRTNGGSGCPLFFPLFFSLHVRKPCSDLRSETPWRARWMEGGREGYGIWEGYGRDMGGEGRANPFPVPSLVNMMNLPKYTVDGPRSVVLPPVVMVDTSCATHRSGNTGGVGSASAREAMPADASPSKIMVDMFYPKFCKIFIICSHLGTR